ncbi:MAG TPA: hypothetical protein VMW42_12940 [Desulfatiglandales bacterium]|nr:hypothetical protein [Desulfatiglandales bacterium]
MPVTKMICQSCGHTYNLPSKTAREEGFLKCPSCGYHTNSNQGKGMRWLKSFREQMLECREVENSFMVEGISGERVLVCDRFKCRCHSGVCFDMRKDV